MLLHQTLPKKSLPTITLPAILFQGRLDSDIKSKSMDFIYNKIGSTFKRKIWLEHNDHTILDSPDHDQIVTELLSFINEIS